MSCNTQGFEKIKPQPSPEKVIEDCKANILKALDNSEKIATGTFWNEEDKIANKDMDRYFPFESKEDLEEHINFLKWAAENVHHAYDYQKNYHADIILDNDIFSHESQLYMWLYGTYISADGKTSFYDENTNAYYSEVDYKNDMFRCIDCKPENLYSCEQTIKFIGENQNKLEDFNLGRIISFWQEYPDGVICVG